MARTVVFKLASIGQNETAANKVKAYTCATSIGPFVFGEEVEVSALTQNESGAYVWNTSLNDTHYLMLATVSAEGIEKKSYAILPPIPAEINYTTLCASILLWDKTGVPTPKEGVKMVVVAKTNTIKSNGAIVAGTRWEALSDAAGLISLAVPNNIVVEVTISYAGVNKLVVTVGTETSIDLASLI